MIHPPKPRLCRLLAPLLLSLILAANSSAQESRPATVSAQLKDLAGRAIRVPAPDRPSLLLFVRPSQDHSARALENAWRVLAEQEWAQVVVISTGSDAAAAEALVKPRPWPVVMDSEYELVGRLRVRVWPTTVIVGADGLEIARLAGLPAAHAKDLEAYLQFGAGRIDRTVLQKRLAAGDVVADSVEQAVRRHLRTAEILLAKGLPSQARVELEQALQLRPGDGPVRLAMARAHLLLGEPSAAVELLQALETDAHLGGEVRTLTGGALVRLGQAEQALPVLQQAVKLNPDPAEAQYFLGLAYQQLERPREAAQAFRRAFEATERARMVPIAAEPHTQPADDRD